MSGICGWASQVASQNDHRTILETIGRMLATESVKPEPVFNAYAAATCVGQQATVHQDNRLIIAVSGHPRFQGETQTSRVIQALAAAYPTQGEEILANLYGPFSLAVLDQKDGSALLAVDRIGIEPLSFAVIGDFLVFGSRVGWVAGHPSSSKNIDPQAVFDYLYFHFVPSPRAIYCGQEKLLPGQCVRFQAGRLSKRFYWSLQFYEKSAPFEPLRDEMLTLLEQAVRRAASNNGVGAFLSGGIDSSTVSGLLSRLCPGSAKTYSIGFAAQGYDEIGYARIATRHFATEAYEYYVTPEDVIAAIPLIAQAYDEPFGNDSVVPTYYCARLAANDGVTTLLGGDGGDELFAGNERYAHQLLLELYHQVPNLVQRGLLKPLAFYIPEAHRFPPLRKLRSYIEQASIDLPARLQAYNFLHRTPLAEVFNRDFLAAVDHREPLALQEEVYWRARADSTLNRMLHLDIKFTLADNDIRKVSRMCELAGVEVRYPMLDEDLVMFSGRVPPQMKLHHFKLRYFFKRAVKDLLPAEILAKRKHGFGPPTGIWLRDYEPLQTLAYDSLETLKRRGYVNPGYIDTLMHRHRREHAAYYGLMIWVLMMLEQWLQAHGHSR